jgi:hypothetical protein
VNEGEYGGCIFVCVYENRRMKLLEKEVGMGRTIEGVNPRYTVRTYVNITMYSLYN